jgi:outer membrane protein OmpA-like peptidoglycan-associated protein
MKKSTIWAKEPILVVLVVMMFCLGQNVAAQSKGFFFDVGADYLSRAVATNTALPALVGGHLGFGYTFGRLSTSLEAGYNASQEGDNPKFSGVEVEVSGYQIPMLFKLGVNLMPQSSFSLSPELFAGATYTDTNLIVKNFVTKEVTSWDIVGGVGLSATFNAGDRAKLYFGGYIDYRMPSNNYSDADAQSANFQLKAGVLIYPTSSGGSGSSTRSRSGSSGSRAAPRPTGPARATPYNAGGASSGSAGYTSAGLGAGNDSVLLSALRSKNDDPATILPLIDTRTPNTLTYVMRGNTFQEKVVDQIAPGASEGALAEAEAESTAAQGTAEAEKTVSPPPKNSLAQQRAEIAALKDEIIELNTILTGSPVATLAKQTTVTGTVAGTVYYQPNETREPVIYSVPTLDAVGQKLKDDPTLNVTVRGYAAPVGTKDGQETVSEMRAKYCSDYLHTRWGIAYARMNIEWYGATRKPEKSEDYSNMDFDRAVELVVAPSEKTAAGTKANK